MTNQNDTIAAQATPPGRGGVGIVRISGSRAGECAEVILGHCPRPRYAEYLPFSDRDGEVVDEGLALYFPGPNSFTGEDVLELQGHGGPVVMDRLLAIVRQLGIRRPDRANFPSAPFLMASWIWPRRRPSPTLSTPAASRRRGRHCVPCAVNFPHGFMR